MRLTGDDGVDNGAELEIESAIHPGLTRLTVSTPRPGEWGLSMGITLTPEQKLAVALELLK